MAKAIQWLPDLDAAKKKAREERGETSENNGMQRLDRANDARKKSTNAVERRDS